VERRHLRSALPNSKKGQENTVVLEENAQNFECKPKGLVMFGDVWFTYSLQVQANQKV
jgi:hypothetical protein